jgi:hypothetical protein
MSNQPICPESSIDGSLIFPNTIVEFGPQGPQGVQGLIGPQGVQGAQGFQGTQGVQGFQGVQGIQGVQGPQGFQGNQGFQGVQGIQGPQGVQGPQGFQGNQGATGVQGVQGPTGPQGVQGAQGNTGAQGVQGPTGPQGTQGAQGPGVPTTRTISTTAPLSGGGDLSADRTLSIPAATTSVDGYLTAANWTTFNNKIGGSGTRTAAYLPIFSASDTITNSDILKVGTTYNFNNSSNVTISRELKGYDLGDGDYTLSVSSADVLINTQLRVSNFGSNNITLNSSGLNMGTLPILGATSIAMGGALSGATDITGSGKLSIANIGASGTLNVGSTTTATKRLELTADNSGGAENNTLRFVNTDTTILTNELIGKIEFYSADASTPGAGVKAYISAGATSATPNAYLDFATDAVTGTPIVRQRIQADGKVLIGSTTDNGSTNLVQVSGGLDYNIVMRGTGSTAYTLLLTDKGKFFETTSGSAIAVTIPTNASVAFPIGTQIWFVQGGAGVPTFSGDTGVTLRTRSSVRQPFARYSEVKLTKVATDEWYLTGDLKA